MKKKPRVLVLLGWHDERSLGALVCFAQTAGWHLETRHFFDETLPNGWVGEGMIISNTARPNVLRFMHDHASRQPTVLIDRNHPGVPVAAHVHEDNVAAGRLAAEHLLAMGHKHFVWLPTEGGSVINERLKGFQDALASASCKCEILSYRASAKNGEWSRRRNWLGRQLIKLPRPVGLFAMDDQLAAEAIEMCLECGLDVPVDVAVVGVGNIALASMTSHVPITSVDNDPVRVATEGARLLYKLMNGGAAPNAPVIIPPKGLVMRESSSALGVTHPLVLQMVGHLRANLSKPYNAQELSRVSGVSVRTIYNLFKSELRATPTDFLQREQLAKARAMLKSGESNIGNLVEACGFGTARTMNRLFLRYEGCSPKIWRDHNRESPRTVPSV